MQAHAHKHTNAMDGSGVHLCIVVMDTKLLSVAADFPHAARIIRDKDPTE